MARRIAKKNVEVHARDMERHALLGARIRRCIRQLAKYDEERRRLERRWGL